MLIAFEARTYSKKQNLSKSHMNLLLYKQNKLEFNKKLELIKEKNSFFHICQVSWNKLYKF